MSFLGEGALRGSGVSTSYWAFREIPPKSLRKNFLIFIRNDYIFYGAA